jgi:hypothetical protein
MSLEQKVQKLMDDAVERNPLVLGTTTGERPGTSKVSSSEELDLILDICQGLREAILLLAREIDESKAA